ncbi:MAG TPA: HEAT repeat domain-containing protein [Gemmataceae bacterium]|nr:HEAT repeat domain-containing protein [Gemmataceae bacterium]
MVEVVVFTLVAVCGLFWLAYRRPRPRRWLLPRPAVAQSAARPASGAAGVGAAVDRQHRHLQAGGLIGETASEATRARFQELLAAGRIDEVEGELLPGLDFAVRVKALAEIGTPDAAVVLERQLDRALSPDPVEQAWYWVDLATALRKLNRTSALPGVLRCAAAAEELHQGVVLAAEAVAFPNFPAALHDLASADGRLAVRALSRAARGCRCGTADPTAMVRAGLGDHLAAVCETAPPVPDPWLAETVLEAERISRRLAHWARLLAPDARPLAARQGVRLLAAAGRRAEWLSGAAARLVARFPTAPTDEQTAALRCLYELRADTADLFPGLPDRRAVWWADAVRALTWAKLRALGPVLAGQAAALFGGRHGTTGGVVLAALRGHRCREAEGVLTKAAVSPDPAIRRAACGAIGWWVPFDPNTLVPLLGRGRGDPDPAARRATVAALARLGERAALQEFAEALGSEEPSIRPLAALTVAEEGLSWLWPDVQDLAESADPDTALAATEALERMREQTLGPLG